MDIKEAAKECRCCRARSGLLHDRLWSSLRLMVAHFSSLEKLNLSLFKLGKTGVFYEGFQETAPYCRNQIFDYLERVKFKKFLKKNVALFVDSK